jgi:hypothetical protein
MMMFGHVSANQGKAATATGRLRLKGFVCCLIRTISWSVCAVKYDSPHAGQLTIGIFSMTNSSAPQP